MKTRIGFVSNSSSASFSIPLDILNPELINKIKDYRNTLLEMTYGPETKWPSCRTYIEKIEGLDETDWVDDSWRIWETDTDLRGDTSMDNSYFDKFLIRLGVPIEKINYERD
jgi:hypothetical protein